MGPTALFDKSFLQSLNLDEAVLFDCLFITNICPMFYLETLADLKKVSKTGKVPEAEVSRLSEKSPDIHGSPNIHHTQVCLATLLGHDVPLIGQIVIAQTSEEIVDGKRVITSCIPPEVEALSRWRSKEFSALEADQAQEWRNALIQYPIKEYANLFKKFHEKYPGPKTLEHAKRIASRMRDNYENLEEDDFQALFGILQIPRQHYTKVLEVWRSKGKPSLTKFAPYAAYLMELNCFMGVAMAFEAISTDRPSNLVDVAYLSYLPFCEVFISNDKLHERCAPLFLREDQQFVKGGEIKNDLRKIAEEFNRLPEATRRQGLYAFGGRPPKTSNGKISRLWDQYRPRWRDGKEVQSDEIPKEALELLKQLHSATPIPQELGSRASNEVYAERIERRIPKKKGTWQIFPETGREL